VLQKSEPVSRTNDGLVDILTLGLLPLKAGFYLVFDFAEAFKESEPRALNPRADLIQLFQLLPAMMVQSFVEIGVVSWIIRAEVLAAAIHPVLVG
jgi:hypothetical protein